MQRLHTKSDAYSGSEPDTNSKWSYARRARSTSSSVDDCSDGGGRGNRYCDGDSHGNRHDGDAGEAS